MKRRTWLGKLLGVIGGITAAPHLLKGKEVENMNLGIDEWKLKWSRAYIDHNKLKVTGADLDIDHIKQYPLTPDEASPFESYYNVMYESLEPPTIDTYYITPTNNRSWGYGYTVSKGEKKEFFMLVEGEKTFGVVIGSIPKGSTVVLCAGVYYEDIIIPEGYNAIAKGTHLHFKRHPLFDDGQEGWISSKLT